MYCIHETIRLLKGLGTSHFLNRFSSDTASQLAHSSGMLRFPILVCICILFIRGVVLSTDPLTYANRNTTRRKSTLIKDYKGNRVIALAHRKDEKLGANPIEVFSKFSSMVNNLYPQGQDEFKNKSLAALLSYNPNQMAFRTSNRKYTWFPIGCHVLGYEFKRMRPIVLDSSTKIWLIKEIHTGQLFIWKRYSTFAHYSVEISFFSVSDHPNIAKAECTMMEKTSGGKFAGLVLRVVRGFESLDFFDKLNTTERKHQVIRIGSQLYDCLKYVHWLGYTHGDVKPSNVVVDYHGNGILIDFGFTLPTEYYSFGQGTPNTIAPEMFGYVPISRRTTIIHAENTDWFSFGQTLVQWLAVPMRHIDGQKFAATKFWRQRYELREYPLTHIDSMEMRQLLYYLLNPDPHLRVYHTEAQLQFLESMPIWKYVNFAQMQAVWHSN